MNKIKRRTFLKGTAGVAGGGALAALLSGGPRTLVEGAKGAAAPKEEWVPTTCWIGKQDCGMLARKVNGRVVKFTGHPDNPKNKGTLCPKGVAQIQAIYDPNRVKTPLVRTNGKGVPGKFRKASWDEALTLVGGRIKEVRKRDRRLLIWQKGRSKAKKFYDTAFVKASGATKLHHGAYCSDAGYRAAEYTTGLHGVLHPDFRYCNYLLAWGWNVTNAGGNKTCWLTWPQQLTAAKERGMKMISIDPRSRPAAHFADEWVPIKPGTDMALALALCNRLIERGYLDREYLTKHTNSPFLVKEDGKFLRIGGKEAVWDPAEGKAKAFDTKDLAPALEGEFETGGAKVKTSFQLFKEHVAKSTPEWAEKICGVPAASIRQIADDLGKNATIGATIVVDGVTLPHRPVSVMAYHMSQTELGFQTIRAMMMVFMLLGAIEAVGGVRTDWKFKVHKNWKKLDKAKVKDGPYNIYLKDSKFYPINSNLSGIVAKVMLNPKKYEVDYVPEVMIIHMANPLGSFCSTPDFIASYKKFKFIAVIDPFLNETASLFADVVLPAATIEKYEGPMNATDQYTDAVSLRIPPMDPLYDSRGDIDIYIGLCEKAGILYGKKGYIDLVNKALKIKGSYQLPLDRKPATRDIFDRWAKSSGIKEGVAYFEKKGVLVKGPVKAKKYYGYAQKIPFNGLRHRLYGESLLRLQGEMREKGAEKIYWQDYTPFPVWRQLTMDKSPPKFDFTLISFKLIEFKQARAAMIPLLKELAPETWVDINPKAAKKKGIRDGEMVFVESHNALTGETRKVKVRAHYSEGLHPETVAMPAHYGKWVHPWGRGHGPNSNELFFTGEGYVTNTADQSFQVKVRVFKAEEV